MESPFDALLNVFGRHSGSRIVAGTLIAGLFFAARFLFIKPDVGQWWQWALAGAAMGLTAALLLTWPRAIFGTVLTLIGSCMALIPATSPDGEPISMQYQLTKAGIGVAILACGIALFVRARNIKRGAQQAESTVPVKAAPSASPTVR